MNIQYFDSIDEVIEIHRKTVEVSGGGALGILNLASLEAALYHITIDDYYPDFVDKLTHLCFVANKSHCFQDGNKRIAISLGMMFLIKNGFLESAKRFIYKMEIISYHLAAGRISKELLKEIIYSIVYQKDYSEILKLKIIQSIDVDILDGN